MATLTYDIVIIGGGLSGLVLAARLSENADLKVAVVEAGEDLTADPRFNTPGMWQTLTNGPADWAFESVPQVCSIHSLTHRIYSTFHRPGHNETNGRYRKGLTLERTR
jgi:choline dehydrogenase-like flavoprotein